MDQGSTPRGTRRRPFRSPVVLLLAIALVSMFAVTGCTHSATGSAPAAGSATAGSSATSTAAAPATAHTAAPAGAHNMDMTPADASAAWNARPAFVNVDARTQEAYAYALYYPKFVQWMPCYCGCGAMGHQSNLDCYLKKSIPGRPTEFEEHASFCEICVDTTLMLKTMIGQGKSLMAIRNAIDAQFGGNGHGTPTPLPPV